MNKIFIIVLISIFSAIKIDAQINDTIQLNCINDFFDGYNTQNFEKIRHTFSPVFKLLLSKSKVKLIYETQYGILGKANISNITKRSEGTYLIQIKYERDTTEIENLGLSISKKGKIIGMNAPGLKYRYPFTNQGKGIENNTLKNKIDSISNLKFKAANFNGCVLVLKNKSPFYVKSFGYADFENKTPLNENTLFDLASLSKQFTAMSIMLLKNQGKLDYAQK
jgi:hypothetical protein